MPSSDFISTAIPIAGLVLSKAFTLDDRKTPWCKCLALGGAPSRFQMDTRILSGLIRLRSSLFRHSQNNKSSTRSASFLAIPASTLVLGSGDSNLLKTGDMPKGCAGTDAALHEITLEPKWLKDAG